MPAFGWTAVKGADHYDFQIAPDGQFRSEVHGVRERFLSTRNLRATINVAVPDGDYYWRVRAVAEDGSFSKWSVQRRIVKSWRAGAALLTPDDGAALTYPENDLLLQWAAVPRAAHYLLEVAKDPALGSIVINNGKPQLTAATAFTIMNSLPPGQYFWRITPLDAKGNRGVASPVRSFTWRWSNSKPVTNPVVDIVADNPDMVFDPRLSWRAVPGAVRYEVEVNSSIDWSPTSRVCCNDKTTGLSLYPKKLFRSNTYYWRVRAFDVDGNAGVWSDTGTFRKEFAKPGLAGLSLRTSANTVMPTGSPMSVPIVGWNPVAGASAYDVRVAPFEANTCNYSTNDPTQLWNVRTSTPFWTPLAAGLNQTRVPFPQTRDVKISSDPFKGLKVGQAYCVQVRAVSDRDAAGNEVHGEFHDLPATGGPAFTYAGNPNANPGPGAQPGYLAPGDYGLPTFGSVNAHAPLFTWRPTVTTDGQVPKRYFVVVARDPEFTNLVDYAFTEIPAYAPRAGNLPWTYSEETTSFYWAVIPARDANGFGTGNHLPSIQPSRFDKRTAPPTLGASWREQDHQTLTWSLVPWARSYRLQVSLDDQFSNIIDDVRTNATAFTSERTYPAAPVLFWRVQALDEKNKDFQWSATGSFAQTLGRPSLIPSKTTGDDIPTMFWTPVPGAVSYDLHIDQPDGTSKDFRNIRSTSATFVRHYGTGMWRWKVRAVFPDGLTTTTVGPYMEPIGEYLRTISDPHGVRNAARAPAHLFQWEPKDGAKQYRVQVSNRPDFKTLTENVFTDNTSYAPRLYGGLYELGGPYYWRVAAVDEGKHVGKFSVPKAIRTPLGLRVVGGRVLIGRSMQSAVRVTNAFGLAVPGATVRMTGPRMRPRVLRTNRIGAVTFRNVLIRNAGRLTFTVSKRGYRTTTRTYVVG
jgi:hypothetical protein